MFIQNKVYAFIEKTDALTELKCRQKYFLPTRAHFIKSYICNCNLARLLRHFASPAMLTK